MAPAATALAVEVVGAGLRAARRRRGRPQDVVAVTAVEAVRALVAVQVSSPAPAIRSSPGRRRPVLPAPAVDPVVAGAAADHVVAGCRAVGPRVPLMVQPRGGSRTPRPRAPGGRHAAATGHEVRRITSSPSALPSAAITMPWSRDRYEPDGFRWSR